MGVGEVRGRFSVLAADDKERPNHAGKGNKYNNAGTQDCEIRSSFYIHLSRIFYKNGYACRR